MFIDDDGPTLEQSYDLLMLQRAQDPDPVVRDALALGMAACTSNQPSLVRALFQEARQRAGDLGPALLPCWAAWAIHNDRSQALRVLIDEHGLTLHQNAMPDHPGFLGDPLFALIDRHGGPAVQQVLAGQNVPWIQRWTVAHHHARLDIPGPMNRVSWLLLQHHLGDDALGRAMALLDQPEVQADQDLLDHALRCAAGVSRHRWGLSPAMIEVTTRLLDLGARTSRVWDDVPPENDADSALFDSVQSEPPPAGVVEFLDVLTGDPAQDAAALGEQGRRATPEPDHVRSRWDRGPQHQAHRDRTEDTTAHALARALAHAPHDPLAQALAERIDWCSAPLDAFGRSPLAVMLQVHNAAQIGALHHPKLAPPSYDPMEPSDESWAPPSGPSAWDAVARAGWPTTHLAWEPWRLALKSGLEQGAWAPFDALHAHAPSPDTRFTPLELLIMMESWISVLDDRAQGMTPLVTQDLRKYKEVFQDDRQRMAQVLERSSAAHRAMVQPMFERIVNAVPTTVQALLNHLATPGPLNSRQDLVRERLTQTFAGLRERLALEQEALRTWDRVDRAIRPRL